MAPSGKIELAEKQVENSLGWVILNLLGSTIFYPVIFALALVSEIFFGMFYLSDKWEERTLNRLESKLADFDEIPEKGLRELKSHYIERKKKNLQVLKGKLEERLPESKDFPSFESDFAKYEYVRSTLRDHEAISKSILEKYERDLENWKSVQQEIDGAENCKTVEEFKGFMLKLRNQCLYKCRFQQELHGHCLKAALKAQVPIFGLLWLACEKTSLKTALENSKNLSSYHQLLSELHPQNKA